MFAVIALVAGVGMIVFIAFEGSGRRIAVGPSATPTAATPAPPASPSPTAALAVTGDGGGGPIASPVRTPIVRATPAPTPAPVTGADGGELRVEFPEDGEVVVSRRINVFGRAPGGTRVLRVLPDGSIETTAARSDGLWILGVDLEPGANELRFRVEGSEAEPVVVRVTYQPR